jgi:hypothetical protein
MSDATVEKPGTIESPPPAERPAQADPNADARARLNQLAAELIKTHNRRLLVEFLRLRRSLRA